MIHRSYENQFKILGYYANNLKKTNPNTTIELLTFKESNGLKGIFKIYKIIPYNVI